VRVHEREEAEFLEIGVSEFGADAVAQRPK
jgi:hypothetical protein